MLSPYLAHLMETSVLPTVMQCKFSQLSVFLPHTIQAVIDHADVGFSCLTDETMATNVGASLARAESEPQQHAVGRKSGPPVVRGRRPWQTGA